MGASPRWEELRVGDELQALEFPLSLYRLVVEAGANRDFNSIHHNGEYAKSTGARDAYANTLFLQGMWERLVRDFIGDAGTITSFRGFRMRQFNVVGDTLVVEGTVTRLWRDDASPRSGFAELTVQTVNDGVVTVGPGIVTVTIPFSAAP